MNRLGQKDRIQIISCLVEGNSIRATERMTDTHRDSVMRLMVQVGITGRSSWMKPCVTRRASDYRLMKSGLTLKRSNANYILGKIVNELVINGHLLPSTSIQRLPRLG